MAFCFAATGFAQSLYNEEADGCKQLDDAIAQAKKESKFVMVQVGGNWCKWCLRFNEFITTNDKTSKILKDNFVFVHLNFSPKNKNEAAMKRMGNPQRFGFPVLVILDENGQRIHTQNSSYLEKGDGYSEKEVVSFLLNWTPAVCKIY
jgi:thiol:disulfide interchange protein